MTTFIKLKYGRTELELSGAGATIVERQSKFTVLSDFEIGAGLDRPIGSPVLEELIDHDESVLLVVPDATRATASDSVVNLLVRRLIANGTMPHRIGIVFATGIHRPVTVAEKRDLVTPFIFQRIRTFDHSADGLMRRAGLESDRFVRLGEIDGRPIEVNRILTEFEKMIIVGGVNFHYFAGFTGGRKLICPGLASAATIEATHMRAFDFDRRTRRSGVGPGLLDGNPVHEGFIQVAALIPPAFAITTTVDDRGSAIDLHCGHWIDSHRAACESFGATNTIELSERRDLVIVSCGGYPHDINLIQAHKALDAASRACTEGGTIVLLAECPEGLGRPDFLKWFAGGNSKSCAAMLCDRYEVNGQTAWSILEKAERFDIRIMTRLDEATVTALRMTKIDSLDGILTGRRSYVLRHGAKFNVLARD